jgi:CheY-like chemotaxis protein
MRLDYTVLCIDDNISSLRTTKRDLRRHNNNVGINTKFVDVPVVQAARAETNIDVFKARIFSDIASKFKANQIDLVIVDLHLGAIKGHEIIDHIRHNQTMYRPIVFYSGGEGEQVGTPKEHATNQLQDGLKKAQLVGKSVFISFRGDNLRKDLRGICDEMHDEEHKLNASRGLLMERTSEIDAKILGHLRKKETWKSSDPKTQAKIQKIVMDELKRQRKNAFKNACEKRGLHRSGFEPFVDWICNSEETDVARGLDAFSRNNLVRELLKMSDETKDAGDIHSTYFKGDRNPPHLNKIRNVYAHQTEEKIGDTHNDEMCKYIREEVRLHLENVNEVTSKK